MARRRLPGGLFDLVALWVGGQLRPLEQVCLLSMLRQGHRVRLFSYGAVGQVPDGVERCDAREVMPEARLVRHRKSGSTATGADILRCEMMSLGLGAWLDIDMILLKPFLREEGPVFALENEHSINNAVFYFPQQSPLLADMLAFVRNEYPIPQFFPVGQQLWLRLQALSGRPKHVSQMAFTVFGPQALTWFVDRHGVRSVAKPISAFYSICSDDAHGPFMSQADGGLVPHAEAVALHLWNSRLRQPSRLRPDNPPGKLIVHPDSFVARFARQELGFRLESE